MMVKRLVRDESGVALALAIILIVLVGVMGAGLLAFVQSNLRGTVEANQGRKALEIADAGTHAARQHLLGAKDPAYYDVDSAIHSLYYAATCNVDAADPSEVSADPLEEWSPEAGGATRTFAGGQFNVKIRWLSPNSMADGRCLAPETGSLAEGVDYFEVVSTGTYGPAKRTVETVYSTYALQVPRAYYTPGNVNIAGSACIVNVSVFSGGNVDFDGNGGCRDDVTGNLLGSHFKGADTNYGDWNNPPSDKFNKTARGTDEAGVGAVGTVTDSPKPNVRDFGSSTTPTFYRELPDPANQTASQITFPFDYKIQPNADRLCDIAKERQQYHSITSSGNYTLNSWPANSTSETVVCYEFMNTGSANKLIWSVAGSSSNSLAAPYEGCRGPIQQGTLVVKGGNFSTGSSTALFRGIVVVRGPQGAESSEVGSSQDSGKTCLDGFVNASSTITLAGSVRPSTTLNLDDRPGFYGVRLWSWRECYTTSCN
jgi:Tfp pilus assembly protein PilX